MRCLFPVKEASYSHGSIEVFDQSSENQGKLPSMFPDRSIMDHYHIYPGRQRVFFRSDEAATGSGKAGIEILRERKQNLS